MWNTVHGPRLTFLNEARITRPCLCVCTQESQSGKLTNGNLDRYVMCLKTSLLHGGVHLLICLSIYLFFSVVGAECRSSEEQPVLVTSEPSLQPWTGACSENFIKWAVCFYSSFSSWIQHCYFLGSSKSLIIFDLINDRDAFLWKQVYCFTLLSSSRRMKSSCWKLTIVE